LTHPLPRRRRGKDERTREKKEIGKNVWTPTDETYYSRLVLNMWKEKGGVKEGEGEEKGDLVYFSKCIYPSLNAVRNEQRGQEKANKRRKRPSAHFMKLTERKNRGKRKRKNEEKRGDKGKSGAGQSYTV